MNFSVLAAAREQPGRDALIIDGHVWSYRELAARLGAAMESLGAHPALSHAPAARVALLARPEPGAVISLLALVELRRPVVLLHPRSTEAERAALLTDAPADLIIDGTELRVAQGSGESPVPVPVPRDDEEVLAVLATSGTSGAPRAVALSTGALERAAAASETNLGVADDDRWLLALPFAHVGGLSVILRSVRARRAVVIANGAGAASPASSPEALVDVLARDRVTLLSMVPAQLHRLLALPAPRLPHLPHLRAILVGGAAASPALMARARERGLPVLATYGLTESCGQVTTERPGDVTGADCGPPLPGMEVRITGEGAIALRGGSLLAGYLERGLLRPARDEEGWFVTRDAGRLDERGHLHVLGRLDEVMVTAGEKLHPLEVERALEAAPAVAAACAFPVADDERGAVVAVALVANPAAPPATPDDLAAALAVLAPWKRPRHVAWLDALPLGPTGKVDRRAVAAATRSRLTRCG